MNRCDQDSSSPDRHFLQQNILNSLSSAPGDATGQCRCLPAFLNGMKKEACKIILHNLVQLNFTQDNSWEHRGAIVKYAEKMQLTLDRKLGLATAACDYFSTIQPYLNTPNYLLFLQHDANVIIPNLTLKKDRQLYQIYPNKAGSRHDAQQSNQLVRDL
jgi:hypothetical protein